MKKLTRSIAMLAVTGGLVLGASGAAGAAGPSGPGSLGSPRHTVHGGKGTFCKISQNCEKWMQECKDDGGTVTALKDDSGLFVGQSCT